MNTERLTQIVARLRRQGTDDALVEAKKSAHELSSDVWETVSAFGNTHGGVILLGLSEPDGFTTAPDFAIDKVRDQFVSGIGDGGADNAVVVNPPQYELNRVEFEGGMVLAIEIAEVDASSKPCFIAKKGRANGAYKRVDDKDVKLSPTEIFELENTLIPSNADREPVKGASMEDLDPEAVDNLIGRMSRRSTRIFRGADSREKRMERLNLIDGEGSVLLAGLLAVGFYPQQFFPKLVIDVTVHPGVEKAASGDVRFIDRTLCEGSLDEVIGDAMQAIAKNLRTISVVRGTGRADVLEIPEEVLREAISNAVIHREYNSYFSGQSVSVDIYSDRVEITNPGGLWGGKTLENIDDGTSRCRNETLMKLMMSVPLPGGGSVSAEGQGSGIALMIHEMKRRALNPPKFDATFDSFTVTLGRSGVELAENQTWIRSVVDRDLGSHEEALLLMARQNGKLTVDAARKQLGIDSDEIRKMLGNLAELGLLAPGKTDEYRLNGESGQPDEPAGRPSARELILLSLSETVPTSAQELADATGKKLSTVRASVSKLVDDGLVIPTAPVNSPNRRYLKK